MNKVLRVLVVLPAILFVVMGLRWLLAPGPMAAEMGMPLLDGVGLSTQIGDLSAFFLAGGTMALIALITGRRTWYYPPIMLLWLTAVGRTVAWLVHDAALAADMIAVEVVVGILLLVASRRLADRD